MGRYGQAFGSLSNSEKLARQYHIDESDRDAVKQHFVIPQHAYNLFLLEKSARLIKKPGLHKKQNGPTRKLTTADYLNSFLKTAEDLQLIIKSNEQPLCAFLVDAINKRYGLDLRAFLGDKITEAARHLAENSFRPSRGDGSLERRKKTI